MRARLIRRDCVGSAHSRRCIFAVLLGNAQTLTLVECQLPVQLLALAHVHDDAQERKELPAAQDRVLAAVGRE